MNAIDLLTQQHRQVDGLFGQIEKANEEERLPLLEQCAEALTVHTAIEEQIFYPGVKNEATESLLEDSVSEHLQVKRTLLAILDADPEDNIDDDVASLMKDVRHHVVEEESELFPKVRSVMKESELEAMGDRMEQLARELFSEPDVTEHLEDEKNAPASL